jgi:hypothetical protein
MMQKNKLPGFFFRESVFNHLSVYKFKFQVLSRLINIILSVYIDLNK